MKAEYPRIYKDYLDGVAMDYRPGTLGYAFKELYMSRWESLIKDAEAGAGAEAEEAIKDETH